MAEGPRDHRPPGADVRFWGCGGHPRCRGTRPAEDPGNGGADSAACHATRPSEGPENATDPTDRSDRSDSGLFDFRFPVHSEFARRALRSTQLGSLTFPVFLTFCARVRHAVTPPFVRYGGHPASSAGPPSSSPAATKNSSTASRTAPLWSAEACFRCERGGLPPHLQCAHLEWFAANRYHGPPKRGQLSPRHKLRT
jgi:hypothetical protein